jgi:putative ABC transport system substrate-binding protein
MRRRAFLATAALSIPGWRGFALAQPVGRAARIGRLSPLSREADEPMIAGLLAGLQEKGWTEGSNLAVERRYADGDGDKLSAVAAELGSEPN